MDKLQTIGAIKKLVSAGEIEAALNQLVAALEKDPPYEALCQAATQALAQYQRTKRDELLGVINFENAKLNYNQATNQVLTILDYWEEGRTELAPPVVPAPNRIWLYVGAGVLVLAIIGIVFLTRINQEPDSVQRLNACPEYDTASPFNVLIFRFLAFGDKPQRVHQGIRQRLGKLKDQHNLNMDIGIYQDQGDDQILPDNNADATKIAESCKAKLVIYGTEESQSNGANIVTTRYKFLNLGEQFQFTKLRINERTEIDTIPSISSITTSGQITGNIEQNLLRILLGVVALENNQLDTAITLLKGAEPLDSASFMLRNMVLAEVFIKNGEPQQALSTYNNVLSQHPRYNFALENRAALLYRQGDYLAAIQDYNTRLENSPGDINTLQQRGNAHLKAENLKEARQDLEKVHDEKPQDTAVTRQLLIVKQKMRQKEEIKENAERKLRLNPRDSKALTTKAEAAKSIGNYTESIQAAEQLIQQDPRNVTPYTTLIEIYTTLNQLEKVEATRERLFKSGVTKSEAIRKAPRQVRELIRRDSIVVQ
jgi:tetratricopeptide (TPR) repeat protein